MVLVAVATGSVVVASIEAVVVALAAVAAVVVVAVEALAWTKSQMAFVSFSIELVARN